MQSNNLDEFVRERGLGADFIKINTEGHEKMIILRPQNLIKSRKPVLSISAYHRKGDVGENHQAQIKIQNMIIQGHAFKEEMA